MTLDHLFRQISSIIESNS